MSAAGDAIQAHAAHLEIDSDSDLILEALCQAAGELFDFAHTVAVGSDTLRPGQALWDAAVAPIEALPWTAQLSGARIPARTVGESDAAYLARVRDAVIHVRGWRRGSPEAIVALSRGHLTGSQLVTLVENYQGSIWRLLVITYDAETPDPVQTAADLVDPEGAVGGVRIVYRTDPGWNYGQAEDTYATYGAAQAAFATYGDAETHLPS